MRRVGAALAALLITAGVVFSIWMHYAGPCELYRYTPAKDVPARCFMQP